MRIASSALLPPGLNNILCLLYPDPSPTQTIRGAFRNLSLHLFHNWYGRCLPVRQFPSGCDNSNLPGLSMVEDSFLNHTLISFPCCRKVPVLMVSLRWLTSSVFLPI